MKIQFCSDLHLEFEDIEIKNNGSDVLILAGDILVANDLHEYPEDRANPSAGPRHASAHRFRNFLKRVSNDFRNVIYIAGNHEYYHGKWAQTVDIISEECASLPNVHFLDGSSITIDDVTFIGGTLWTNCNKGCPTTMYELSTIMNDYKVVRVETAGYRRLKPADTAARHAKYLKSFDQEYTNHPENKIVVVSHHAPSTLSIAPAYQDDHYVNGGYVSDLSEFILDRPRIKYWIHGHVHNVFNYQIGDTRILTNPRGYHGYENTGWDPLRIIEI